MSRARAKSKGKNGEQSEGVDPSELSEPAQVACTLIRGSKDGLNAKDVSQLLKVVAAAAEKRVKIDEKAKIDKKEKKAKKHTIKKRAGQVDVKVESATASSAGDRVGLPTPCTPVTAAFHTITSALAERARRPQQDQQSGGQAG